MKMMALVVVLMMLICGCSFEQSITSNEPPKAESAVVSSSEQSKIPTEPAIENIPVAEPTPGITQPPCLACEDVEINPSTDDDISELSEEEKREQLYASKAPAKQSWLEAYKSFYNSEMIPTQEYIDIISSTSVYSRAKNNLELRSDMGIEFSYPIYETLFVHVDTIASNGSTPAVAIKCAVNGGMGMLVNYMDNGSFAGEIVFGKDDIFEGEFIYNADSSPEFILFEQGNYHGRSSLTVTEGIEAQLIGFGFAPENTSAFALRLSDDEYGVCFYDDEKAAYYNNVTKRGKSLDQKLYSFEELRDKLCEIYDVCSVEEIDILLAPKDQEVFGSVIEPSPGVSYPIVGSDTPPQADGINERKETVNPPTAKPVIYLYPECKTEVSVKLGYPAGHFTYTYPAYKGGWNVTAYPDGRLINSDGSEHYYLFWEGDMPVDWDLSEGFIVRGKEVEAFLKEKLEYMGLIPREYNDFITYWTPEMCQNEYNLVSFSFKQYEDIAPLDITPQPDSVLRVHMVYKAIDKPIDIKAQQLEPFERNGFTVVEWGGSRA